MDRQPVDSSNLSSVGYDADAETLEVEFHDGSVYQYFGVPSATHQSLLQAPSVGSYFNSHVRDSFDHRRLS